MVACILNLGTRWKRIVSFTSWPLYPWEKNARFPLDRRLGRPQISSGHSGKEKNPCPYCKSNPSSPAQPSYYTDK
jgi:hypothetical protein